MEKALHCGSPSEYQLKMIELRDESLETEVIIVCEKKTGVLRMLQYKQRSCEITEAFTKAHTSRASKPLEY